MAKLNAQKRKRLPKSSFALPSKKLYPIPDIAHARSALSYAARSDTEGDEKTVRAAVLKKFPGLKKTGGSKLQKWDR